MLGYPELMTRRQVTDLIGATISEMHSYMSQQAIPATNVNGYWKIKRDDVRAFIETHRHHAGIFAQDGIDRFDALKFYRQLDPAYRARNDGANHAV
jgi:hypothetical protein